MKAAPPLPVWGAGVRAGHWALAGCVVACLWLYQGGAWHERLGYAALALVLARIAVGLKGRTAHLRFDAFVRTPGPTWAYARDVLRGRERRHLGHNPLGGWMIVALLGTAAVAAGSGALYATDRWWGDAALYEVHRIAGWGLALLAPLHVAGVVLASLRQRENLVRAMLDGRKRAPAPGDVGLP